MNTAAADCGGFPANPGLRSLRSLHPGLAIFRADGAGALAKGWRSSFRSQTIIAARSRALVARGQLKYFSGFTSENFESVIN